MAKATRERAAAKKKYDNNVAESDATLEAVKECQKLLRGLQRGGGSFVQIKQAQRHVAKFAKKLTVSKAWGHLAKALVDMSQDFANKKAVRNVLKLFDDLESNLGTSREQMDQEEKDSILTFNELIRVCTATINGAEGRLKSNRDELAVVQADIDHQEELRDTARSDRDNAQTQLTEEEARWEKSVASYEDFIGELKEELAAVDKVLDVFASANINDGMLERIDW